MVALRRPQTFMTQAKTQIPANTSRLVRFLAELGGADKAVSNKQFTERLGQLFDLPDSIRLSTVHGKRPAPVGGPPPISREDLKAEFLRTRAAIISSAVRSFVPGGGTMRLRFPTVTPDLTLAQTMTAEPYLAFYAAQQRDIDFRIRNLHASTREAVAGFSQRLAQLAELDAALGDPLSNQNRRFFAAVGQVLGKRIESLLTEYRQSGADEPPDNVRWAQTLAQLRAELQSSLLAEIETRMLPTLGLIEALDEQEDE